MTHSILSPTDHVIYASHQYIKAEKRYTKKPTDQNRAAVDEAYNEVTTLFNNLVKCEVNDIFQGKLKLK